MILQCANTKLQAQCVDTEMKHFQQILCRKDTWSPLSAADKVQTGSYYVISFPAPGQSLVHSELVKIVCCVNAMLVHLELVTNMIYPSFTYTPQKRKSTAIITYISIYTLIIKVKRKYQKQICHP